jgi:hypothetical protein
LYYSDFSYSSDIPLYESFNTSESASSDYPEFNDFEGGDSGGGGADGGWDSDIGDGGGDGGGCSGGCGGGD